jgi:hypothetical protein
MSNPHLSSAESRGLLRLKQKIFIALPTSLACPHPSSSRPRRPALKLPRLPLPPIEESQSGGSHHSSLSRCPSTVGNAGMECR